jgi:hypothetical protein
MKKEKIPVNSCGWTWRVFLSCWLVYTVFWVPYIVREHFAAMAVAESGSLNVMRYLGWSEDIFQGPRGAYINNNPGASLTGAIPLVLLRPVLARVDAWNQKQPHVNRTADDTDLFWRALVEGRAFYFLLVGFTTVAMVMAPATAGTAAYLCSRLIESGVPSLRAAQAALLYGIVTPVLFRVGHLNHNLLVGDAGFTAFLLLWDPNARALHPARGLIAGLLAGYAVLCDYSGLVVLVVLALYVWLRSAGQLIIPHWRSVVFYIIGVIPGIAILMIYQAWAFGSFILPAQHFMPPTAPTSQGYRGFGWPSPALLWANFFDPRFGLFVYCPALLLAFMGPFTHRAKYRLPKLETGIFLMYFGLFVLFCAANRYSWLQPLTGFRYLVPVVPILAILALQTGQVLPQSFRCLIAMLSCAQSLIIAAAHGNDVRFALATLWQRRFELTWMIRLRDAGVPVDWRWPVATYVRLATALASIWFVPRRTNSRVALTDTRGVHVGQ